MFLSALKADEKEAFLELAHHLMVADGEVHDEEREVFESYLYECELPGYKVQQQGIKNITEKLKDSDKKTQKIILVELWGMILADTKVGDQEKDFMDSLAREWGFNESQNRRMRRWAKDFTDIIGDGYRLIEN